MFGLYFGHYLVEKNKISQSQFEDVMLQFQKSRAKLGFIAVTEKLLTAKQADEINDLQKKTDKRFGDIAIEKGYLLNEEVTYLLNMQGNSYLRFLQLLAENMILSIEEIEGVLKEFQQELSLSDSDLDDLKSGDIDRIIPVFLDIDNSLYRECISLTIRNIVRFINSNIIIKKSYIVNNYSFRSLVSQKLAGTPGLFIGLAGRDTALLSVANPFAREEFQFLNEDAFDSVCEFINCSNGIYASKLSQEDILLEMAPPEYHTDKSIISEGDIYIVPFLINGEQADIIVTMDNRIGIH